MLRFHRHGRPRLCKVVRAQQHTLSPVSLRSPSTPSRYYSRARLSGIEILRKNFGMKRKGAGKPSKTDPKQRPKPGPRPKPNPSHKSSTTTALHLGGYLEPDPTRSTYAPMNGEDSSQSPPEAPSKGEVRQPLARPAKWTTLQERLKLGTFPGPKGPNTQRATEDDTTLNDASIEKQSASQSAKSFWQPSNKPSRGSRQEERPIEMKDINPRQLRLTPVEADERGPEIPGLSHNLDRVLFNPGVYQLQDARSGVYNFDPFLASIMPVDEFDFNALKDYITSSKDNKLQQLAREAGLKYCGSTSSLTSVLSQFHFLLSAWRRPFFGNLSKSLEPESTNFTLLTRGPAAAFARYQDGVYAFDADKQYDQENVLSMLGKSMEKLLTLPKEEFEKYSRDKSHQIPEEQKNADEAYHYTTLGNFMMRSQLDAHDPRLPGSGVFDLKTRAVVSIRMDVQGYEKGVGYEIRNRFGQWESFEREYYDLIRAAFLKYSLQVRMGRMDGIFVAFHNTRRIFGFQYIPLSEMDEALHGTPDRSLGDQEFKASLALLNDLMDRATERFPGRSLRLHVETRPTKVPLTYFFVQPVDEEEMRQIQEASQPKVEDLEREIRGLSQQEQDAELAAKHDPLPSEQQKGDSEPSSEVEPSHDQHLDDTWQEMMSKVEATVDDESLGVGPVREAIQEALAQTALLRGKSDEECEQYLTALVGAFTAPLDEPGGEVGVSAQEAEVDEATSEVEAEDGQDLHEDANESSRGTTAEDVEAHDDEETQGELLEDTMSNVQESVDVTAGIEGGQVPNGDRDGVASLRNLILRVVEEMDENKRVQRSTQRSREVERLFTKLASEAESGNFDEPAAAQEEPQTQEQGTVLPPSGQTTHQTQEADGVEESTIEDEITDAQATAEDRGEEPTDDGELLGMYVTIRNRVNGVYVERPTKVRKDTKWDIQYAIQELPNDKARRILKALKNRRKKVLGGSAEERSVQWHRMFSGTLPVVTRQGKAFRKKMTKREEGRSVTVAWDKRPLDSDAAAKHPPSTRAR